LIPLTETILLIKSVHQKSVEEQQQQETEDGALLSHPETKWSAANAWQNSIELFSKQDSTP